MLATKFGIIPSAGAMWLDGWSYGKRLTIPNGLIDADLTNFPLPVYLDATNFDFTKAKGDGSDIRFTDKSLNQLKFERKEHLSSKTYLYNAGDECVSLTGGWRGSSNNLGATIYKNASSIRIAVANNKTGVLISTKMIDLTPYSKIKINCTATSGAYPQLMLTTVQDPQNGSAFTSCATLSATGVYEFDVSSVNQSMYVSAIANWTSASITFDTTIDALWLEADNPRAVYNVQIPTVTDATDTEVYMWYGNASAYNASMEAHQDMTGKALTYNGDVKLVTGVQTGKRVASFDGTGDYFSLASSSDFAFSTGDLCIEFILKITARVANSYIFDTGGGVDSLFVAFDLAGNFLRITDQGVVYAISPTLAVGQQYHIAVVRSSGSTKIYVDGVGGTAVACGINFTQTMARIGYSNYNGSIYGLRITKGSARYTANFTPPTTFTIDSANVVLCTNFDTIYDANYVMVQHMGTSLVDASGNNNSGTATGTTVVDTAYGKARSFNGNGDYIALPNSIASLNCLHQVGTTGKWTFETTVTALDFASNNTLIDTIRGTPANKGVTIQILANRAISVVISATTSDWVLVATTAGIYPNDNNMHNIEVTYDQSLANTNCRIFLDGVFVASGSKTALTPSTANCLTPWIGSYSSSFPLENWIGNILNMRISSNIARSDAWIKAESLGLKNTLLKIENVYEVLADITVQSATTSVDFTGLNLGKGDEVMLVCDIENPIASTVRYDIYANNNATPSNYYNQELLATSTSVAGARSNTPVLSYVGASSRSTVIANIKLTNSGYFITQSHTSSGNPSAIQIDEFYVTSTFTSTSITQLTVKALTSDAIGIGSRFQLYKIGRAI